MIAGKFSSAVDRVVGESSGSSAAAAAFSASMLPSDWHSTTAMGSFNSENRMYASKRMSRTIA